MQKILIALGVIGMLMTIVGMVIGLRYTFDPPPFSGIPFEIALTADESRAEMDRLADLRDETLQASLGGMASAAVGCIEGSLGKKPDPAVLQAAKRFFVTVFAMRNRVESPLIDPRTAEIPLDGPPSVEGLMQDWARKGESKGTIDRWRWILAFYAKVTHPIYSGIVIQPGGWENADLDNLFLAVKLNGDSFISCYRSRAAG